MNTEGQIFKHNCGRCGARSVAFTIRSEPYRSRGEDSSGSYAFDVFAVCGNCNRGSVATYIYGSRSFELEYARLSKLSPRRPSTDAPAHTPQNVAHFYRQAVRSMPGLWDAAGSMFRKTLESALKAKFPSLSGSLYDRIKSAGEKGWLTKELAAWADHIRLDGNDAIHDENPFEQDQAETLATFTRLILLYLFTLPGMLAEAQGTEGEAQGSEAGAPPTE
ncbi:MAG: DUF4145 domain-containing protein [Gammaproteobacteria bacterium]|nr:DUF4145 domain-containing protein [Gammaproteobacteria bacterium]